MDLLFDPVVLRIKVWTCLSSLLCYEGRVQRSDSSFIDDLLAPVVLQIKNDGRFGNGSLAENSRGVIDTQAP
ncbi:hypothetical protein ACOSQ3_013262 [Xanthoceras sorbifolium]